MCNVFTFHQLYSPADLVAQVDPDCRSAKIGCVECKKKMAEHLVAYLSPIRDKIEHYKNHTDQVEQVMAEGSDKARQVAAKTLAEVRDAVRI